jgi:hypothetical protein
VLGNGSGASKISFLTRFGEKVRSLSHSLTASASHVGVHFARNGNVYVGWIDNDGQFQLAEEKYAYDGRDGTAANKGAALRAAFAKLPAGAPRSIAMASPIHESALMIKQLAPNMPIHERIEAALIAGSDLCKDLEIKNPLAAVEPIGKDRFLFGYTSRSQFEYAREIASAAGLKLVSLDHEARAWRRAVGGMGYDAVIHLDEYLVSLTAFRGNALYAQSFERLNYDGGWVNDVVNYIESELRSKEYAEARNVAVFTSVDPETDLERVALFREEARCESATFLNVSQPGTGQEVTSPPWYLAFGLARSDDDANAAAEGGRA